MYFLGKMIKIKKLKQKNKKGSHIGIILSIVIFVGFLIFLYVIMGPAIKPQKDKQALLDSLEIRLLEQVSSDLTTVTMSISNSYTPIGNCISIAHVEEVGELDSIVKDEDGNPVNSNPGTNLDIDWTGGRFFKIYYSEESFDDFPLSNGCDNPVINSDYFINSIKTNEKIFETKILTLISLYEGDYGYVKELLRVPEGNDFSFNFTYNNRTNIGTVKQIPLVNVYVEEIPVQYVNREANLEPGAITIKVW